MSSSVQPKFQYQLATTLIAGDLKTIKSAAEAACDLNQIDQFHKTPLMIACANGRLSVVKLLLALG